VRDPRDAMFTAVKVWRGQDGGLTFQSNEFCRRTLSKISTGKKLAKHEHSVLKYEQVSADVHSKYI
jgi:anti-sigma factor ChrR (cupin superfamily)